MPTTALDIEPIGQVLFAKSKRAKRLSITLKPFKPVRVAVPHRVSIRKARKYLNSNIEWVKKHLPNIRRLEQKHKTMVKDSPLICKKEAKELLISRLNQLAQKYGFSYKRIFIRNQKTRWGSCSQLNNISLNVKLLRLKDELVDYVILHELVHTRIKNHSKKYWAELDKYTGNAKALDKELKKFLAGV